MPIELRELTFDQEEALEALRGYASPSRRFDAAALGVEVDADVDGRPWARLRLKRADGTAWSAPFDATEIAAALMRYCFRSGVPLPRGSRKRLILVGGKLVLSLWVDFAPVDGESPAAVGSAPEDAGQRAPDAPTTGPFGS